jgi:hypothetical protein
MIANVAVAMVAAVTAPRPAFENGRIDETVTASALASDVGDVQGEPGASSGKDAGRSRTGPFVEDEDAAGGVIWPS